MIVRGGLIQASNVKAPAADISKMKPADVSRELAAIKEAMVRKHLARIGEAAKRGVQVCCLQEIFFGPYFCSKHDKRWYRTAEPIPGPTVKRMQAAVKAATAQKGALEVRLCQMVKLMRNGEPVKMSKRSGDFITLRDVIDEVGRDAIRFMMLDRKNDAELEFDLAKVIEQSKENPVFYVQYAHARIASVFRQAGTVFEGKPLTESEIVGADLSILKDESERALMRLVAQFPRLVEQAAQTREPHRVVFYLYDLASAFHGLWNRGKDLPDLRFINNDDRKGTLARLALVRATKTVIANGLGLLGVSAPEEMR